MITARIGMVQRYHHIYLPSTAIIVSDVFLEHTFVMIVISRGARIEYGLSHCCSVLQS